MTEQDRNRKPFSFERMRRKARLYAFLEWGGKAGGLMFLGFLALAIAGRNEDFDNMAIAGTLFTLGWGAYGVSQRTTKYFQRFLGNNHNRRQG